MKIDPLILRGSSLEPFVRPGMLGPFALPSARQDQRAYLASPRREKQLSAGCSLPAIRSLSFFDPLTYLLKTQNVSQLFGVTWAICL